MKPKKTTLIFFTGLVLFVLIMPDIHCQPYTPWPDIRVEMKPWTRWWWLGSAVDEKNIEYLLEEYARKGFGGTEITPIYGVKGCEDRHISFLSERWMQVLRYTCEKSDSLDMGVDINMGTGWPFGGPQISPEHAASKNHYTAIQNYRRSGA
ncbi:MAG: hypothetical protein JXK95_16090 [Bacteroidales bacterium]|nr:hypothetical protein [Bacteroidales bacterium]